VPGLNGVLIVPVNQDLFAPKMIVTVVGASLTVRNHDGEAHNLVLDPASPIGAGFIVPGTDTVREGGTRALVVQQPGTYHVYCTLHSKVVGVQDGWRVLAPRNKDTPDYADHNPMESWVIV